MKAISLFVALLIGCSGFSQADKKVSFFLSFQGNKTLYDRTTSNNAGGVGLGFQTVLNTRTWVKPTIEFNGDVFGGTKVLYITSSGRAIESKSGMLSMHVGPFVQLSDQFFFATTIGSHFYNNAAYLSLRPSLGFYPTKGKRWALKTSFTNVFESDDISKKNFGYLSVAIALKL